MNVIGVIPSRWGSSRLPGKSLIPIAGKPLIQWVIEGALRARRLSALLVATDDSRIMDTVKRLGVRCVMTRSEHPSGTDRVAEAVGAIAADVVINIQGDEMFIDAGLIDKLADVMLTEDQWDMATAASPIWEKSEIENPSIVKVVCGSAGQALYFSRSVIPFDRDGAFKQSATDKRTTPYRRHLGIYAYRRRFLEKLVQTPQCLMEKVEKLEQLRALYIGARIAVLGTSEVGVGVDTPEDVRIAEERLLRENRG